MKVVYPYIRNYPIYYLYNDFIYFQILWANQKRGSVNSIYGNNIYHNEIYYFHIWKSRHSVSYIMITLSLSDFDGLSFQL